MRARTVTAKFGGSSMADAGQIHKVMDIVRADPARQFVVVSAPGKRSGPQYKGEAKVTDLLYRLHDERRDAARHRRIFDQIVARYREIIEGFALELPMVKEFRELFARSKRADSKEWVASRGEYFSARILAKLLRFQFVDAKEVIRFNGRGELDLAATKRRGRKILAQNPFGGCVIPGFYGGQGRKNVRTFSRGGSDLTGAIVAMLTDSELYENWTDVSGVLMADPRVVENPRPVEALTHVELRELSYRGATVLHDEVLLPLRGTGIPIAVKNTNRPNDRGTWITEGVTADRPKGSIVGVAGKKGFIIVTVTKAFMNREVGFLERLALCFSKEGVSIEDMPGSIDTLSVTIPGDVPEMTLSRVLANIRRLRPDSIKVDRGIALICVVGSAMQYTPGVAARLFNGIAGWGINVRLIDQGASEVSIKFGVKDEDYDEAVRASYKAFVFEAV